MRRMLSSLALAAVIAASFAQTNSGQNNTGTTNGNVTITSPVQGTTTISTFATTNNMTWEDAAAALALARAYNMQPDMIITQRGTVTSPYFDLAPAYMIASQSGKPFTEIWQMYNNGTTWMDIAHQLNVSPTYYNPSSTDMTSWTNTDFQNGVWTYILQNSYKMTPEDFTYFNEQHVPMNQVVVADVYGMEANRPVRDIYTDYTKYNDWPKMYQSYSSTTTTSMMPANKGNQGNGNNEDMSNSNHTASMVAPDPIKEWQVVDMDPGSEMSAHSSSAYGLSKGHKSSSHKSKKHKSARKHRG